MAEPSVFDAPSFAATLTVYCAAGTFTVENVREDSINVNAEGVLTAECDDVKVSRIFTFYRVGGYSTVLA